MPEYSIGQSCLEEYGCQIEYKQGRNNVPADMLSRIVLDESVTDGLEIEVLDNLPR